MWSKAAVMNQALRHLGFTDFIQDPDSPTNNHARILSGFWDEQVLTHTEMYSWSFATTYMTLSPATEESPFSNLPYVFQHPTMLLKFKGIHADNPTTRIPWRAGITPPGGTYPTPPEHRIYTTIADPVGIYARDVSAYLTLWTETFGAMIAARLAYEYSGVKKGDKATAQRLIDLYKFKLGEAKRVSAEMQGDMERMDDFFESDYLSERG